MPNLRIRKVGDVRGRWGASEKALKVSPHADVAGHKLRRLRDMGLRVMGLQVSLNGSGLWSSPVFKRPPISAAILGLSKYFKNVADRVRDALAMAASIAADAWLASSTQVSMAMVGDPAVRPSLGVPTDMRTTAAGSGDGSGVVEAYTRRLSGFRPANPRDMAVFHELLDYVGSDWSRPESYELLILAAQLKPKLTLDFLIKHAHEPMVEKVLLGIDGKIPSHYRDVYYLDVPWVARVVEKFIRDYPGNVISKIPDIKAEPWFTNDVLRSIAVNAAGKDPYAFWKYHQHIGDREIVLEASRAGLESVVGRGDQEASDYVNDVLFRGYDVFRNAPWASDLLQRVLQDKPQPAFAYLFKYGHLPWVSQFIFELGLRFPEFAIRYHYQLSPLGNSRAGVVRDGKEILVTIVQWSIRRKGVAWSLAMAERSKSPDTIARFIHYLETAPTDSSSLYQRWLDENGDALIDHFDGGNVAMPPMPHAAPVVTVSVSPDMAGLDSRRYNPDTQPKTRGSDGVLGAELMIGDVGEYLKSLGKSEIATVKGRSELLDLIYHLDELIPRLDGQQKGFVLTAIKEMHDRLTRLRDRLVGDAEAKESIEDILGEIENAIGELAPE